MQIIAMLTCLCASVACAWGGGWLGTEKSHRQLCSRRRWFSHVDKPKGSSGFFQVRRGFNPRSPYCEPRLSLKLKVHKDNGAEFWSLQTKTASCLNKALLSAVTRRWELLKSVLFYHSMYDKAVMRKVKLFNTSWGKWMKYLNTPEGGSAV